MSHFAVQLRTLAEATLFWAFGVPAIAVAALVLGELLHLEELEQQPLTRTTHRLPGTDFSGDLEAA